MSRAVRRLASSVRSGLRLSTSAKALASSLSSRSSALTPSPLRPETSWKALSLVLGRDRRAQLLQALRREGHHLVGEVDGLGRLGLELEGPQALDDDFLEVGLAGVDDVVDLGPAAEMRGRGRWAPRC